MTQRIAEIRERSKLILDDTAYFKHSVQDIPWLLDQLEALRAAMDRLLASDGEGRSIAAYEARNLMDRKSEADCEGCGKSKANTHAQGNLQGPRRAILRNNAGMSARQTP